ncbi:hypothetical protein CMV37_00255 [Bacillus cereus]|nr:hypothetical protein CMV37_00255 [Bacillus cereus]
MLNPPLVTYCTQLSVEKASFSVNVYFLGREGEFLRNAKTLTGLSFEVYLKIKRNYDYFSPIGGRQL